MFPTIAMWRATLARTTSGSRRSANARLVTGPTVTNVTGRVCAASNSPAHIRELRRTAESKDPLDDAAPAVEQHGVGEAAVVVGLPHAPSAHQDRERRTELAHERQHLAAVHVVRDRGDLEVLAGELAVQLGHVGELLPARADPRRPEVQELPFPRDPP